MLVIRRRPGEVLMIGENVEIEILEAVGSQVKIGIRAPKEVAVVRKEIRIVGEQNRVASRAYTGGGVNQLLERFAARPGHPLKLSPR